MLIDGNHLAHRAYHRFLKFANIKGESSAVAYGAPFILASLIRRFKPTKVIVCFDAHPLAKERLSIQSDYKLRKPKEGFDKKSFDAQLQAIAKMFSNWNIDIYQRIGEEADDIIYELCRKYDKYSKTIVSADKDFVPLLGNRVKIYNPSKDAIISTTNVKSLYGFTEKEFIDYLILKGDKSDNIKGVHGLGEVKIRNFLDEFGCIEDYIEEPKKNLPWSNYPIEDVYKVNRILINLKVFYRLYRKGRSIQPNTDGVWAPKKNEKIFRKYSLRQFRTPTFLKPFETLSK